MSNALLYMSPMDSDFIDSTIPIIPESKNIIKSIESPKSLPKIESPKLGLIIIIILCIVLIITLIVIIVKYFSSSNELIKKYSNLSNKISNFTNKDQIEFETNNYDIHYLVEQMIYKEFSPSDKKKYLNLPDALKDNLILDYLITKI